MGLVGSARALPALERLSLDPETADIARFALERIPDDAASAVLRDALEKTTGLQRIGIINSLGQRQDRGSCKALAALLGDAELPLARAAAEALGRIADKDATRALAAGKDSALAPNRACVLDAYLLRRCALSGGQGREGLEDLHGTRRRRHAQSDSARSETGRTIYAAPMRF